MRADVLRAGDLDRPVQIRRASLVDDGFASTPVWADLGPLVWASKADISDGERWRAGAVAAMVTTRFQLRWSPFSRTITAKDRLVCEGAEYDITGIKEIGRRVGLEITASRRAD